jgi:hypothetical protein
VSEMAIIAGEGAMMSSTCELSRMFPDFAVLERRKWNLSGNGGNITGVLWIRFTLLHISVIFPDHFLY